MSTDHPVRPSSYGDLFDRLDRIEDKLDRRLNSVDSKVDGLTSRLDRMEGGLGMLKWLGPTGIAALVYGVARSQGLL
jgi:hypothetical protein